MYNDDQKESFIGQYTQHSSTQRVIRVLFGQLEKYERKWGRDISEKGLDSDLCLALEDSLGVRTASRRTMLTLLQSYIRWCVDVGIPNVSTEILGLTVDCIGIERVKLLYVANPTHLELQLDRLFPPISEETSSILCRCFCWLAYAGMKEEDILKVKRSDINLRTGIVRHKNCEYPIYREGASAIDNCSNLDSFIVPFCGRNKRSERVDSDIVMRGVRSLPSVKSIRVELSRTGIRHFEKTGEEIRLSHARLWLSGMFYRMYERECAGFLVDFSDVILDKIGFDGDNLSPDRSKVLTKYRRVRSEMQRDYDNWKKAFHP